MLYAFLKTHTYLLVFIREDSKILIKKKIDKKNL